MSDSTFIEIPEGADWETVVAERARFLASEPVVIEVREVDKTFRIPTSRDDTLRKRSSHPFRKAEYRELRALRGISFDVRRGEFFGIVGRNGSGKSTLLKVLSSIYRADAGTIRVGGQLAPFIELGVGFNPELTARENVALNGVMLGLTKEEARAKLDSVLDFAGLQEFIDLRLKNYSSGMMVRLAFSVMVEADADIMLVDEVLAVGDASFAQKCMSVFHEKRKAGKTVVLVTHDMATVQGVCDRAMLIHDGELRYIGDPEEAALRYYRLNFGGAEAEDGAAPDVEVELVDVWLENDAGERVEEMEQGRPIRFNLVVEAKEEVPRPVFDFQVLNVDGAPIFGFRGMLDEDEGSPDRIAAGHRARVGGEIENRLIPGSYVISCRIARARTRGDAALRVPRLIEFTVNEAQAAAVDVDRYEVGMVSVPADVEATLERAPG